VGSSQRQVKLARCGSEFFSSRVVDVAAQQIWVFRKPSELLYKESVIVADGDTATSLDEPRVVLKARMLVVENSGR